MKTGKPFELPAKALVVGMGASGRSVCELLLSCGVEVTATDLRRHDRFDGALDDLARKGCRLSLGAHRLEDFLGVEQIIVSPGIPSDLAPLAEARKAGVEILGELEWAWRQVDVPVVAVTGTNGKTTTTSLLGAILEASGKRVFVGGNIGTPLSRWVLDGEEADWLVLEVSSFQLDTASTFRPEVGVLLNITEDHLDRYRDFSEYIESKFSIFAHQREDDVAVINLDDPVCRNRAFNGRGRLLTTGRNDRGAHAFMEDGFARVNIPGKEPVGVDLRNSRLEGPYNEENMLAAVLAASALDVPAAAMERAVASFSGLPHRVEWVRKWEDIDFYDDSKGTNVGAVVSAVQSFDRPVLLLLGGVDKFGSYDPLAKVLTKKGKGAFVFGEAAPRLYRDLKDFVPTSRHADLEEAFARAVEAAAPGDVVLLSPACSSFDQYDSYAQRGDHFKRLVQGLGVQ